MAKKSKKQAKTKDRLDEVKNELIQHMGMLHEQTQHNISLVAEQVAHNTEEITKLSEMVDMLRFDLKLKADNLELITLSRRVAILEKKLAYRK